MKVYELAGGDNAANGPIFGPVIAEEVAIMKVGLVLKLRSILVVQNQKVEYIVLAPRQEGSTVETIRSEKTNVGYSRVLPGRAVGPGIPLEGKHLQFFGTGESKPVAY